MAPRKLRCGQHSRTRHGRSRQGPRPRPRHPRTPPRAAGRRRARRHHAADGLGLRRRGRRRQRTSTSSGSAGSRRPDRRGTAAAPRGTCAVSAEETQGPYPADGSNTINGTVSNALALTGIVRSDIRSSFGSMSGTAAGVPVTLKLTLVNANAQLRRPGRLRHLRAGTATATASTRCTAPPTRTTCAACRRPTPTAWPRSPPSSRAATRAACRTSTSRCTAATTTATSYTNKLKTTQLAFPTDVCTTVYTTATGYSASETNFAQISFATDNVFSDGTSTEMATVTGSVADGYAVALQVGISA